MAEKVKRVCYATTNEGKVRTMQEALRPYGIKVVQKGMDMPEPRSFDFKDIAMQKVSYAYLQIQQPCIANDSGFFMVDWAGFPRTYVNFVLETLKLEGILKLAEGTSRRCEFRGCIAYLDSKISEPRLFESVSRGMIAESEQGDNLKNAWSPLWRVFIPEGYEKTLAEMTDEEYQEYRKRREEFSSGVQFAKWISARLS